MSGFHFTTSTTLAIKTNSRTCTANSWTKSLLLNTRKVNVTRLSNHSTGTDDIFFLWTNIDLVVKEAIRCFELNIALFDEIQALSDANQLLPTEEDPSLRRSFKWLLPSTTTTTMVPILVTVVATTALGCAAYFRHRNT